MSNTFLLIANQVAASAQKEIQLLPYGRVESKSGSFVVDEEAISLMMAAFNKEQNDTVIDYEHQTLTPHAAPAAGWIKQLYDRGKDGLWALVEWTEKAAAHIAAKEYLYFSPVVLLRKGDRKAVALHSGGLTNKPAIDGMQPLSNKEEFEEENKDMEELVKQLIQILALPESATTEDILKIISERCKESAAGAVVANKELLELLALKEDASLTEAKAKIIALANPDGYVKKEELLALKEQIAKKESEELVELACKEGKVAPANKAWALALALKDPDSFKAFVKDAPVVVNMDEVAGGKEVKKTAALDDAQLAINKQMGISKEDFEKYGMEEA